MAFASQCTAHEHESPYITTEKVLATKCSKSRRRVADISHPCPEKRRNTLLGQREASRDLILVNGKIIINFSFLRYEISVSFLKSIIILVTENFSICVTILGYSLLMW